MICFAITEPRADKVDPIDMSALDIVHQIGCTAAPDGYPSPASDHATHGAEQGDDLSEDALT